MNRTTRFFILLCLQILLIFESPLTFAAYISNISGKNLVLELMGDSAPHIGEILNVFNSEDIKIGTIKVIKVQGHVGSAILLRGSVEVGDTVKPGNENPQPTKIQNQGGGHVNANPISSSGSSTSSRIFAGIPLKGILLGYNMQTFSIENLTLEGSAPQLGLFGERRINDLIKLRGTFSYFKLDLHDKETGNYKLAIDYLAAQVGVNYFLARNIWTGLHLGYFVPAKKDSNIIAANGLAAANVISAEAGTYFTLGSTNQFLPFMLSYNMFVNSPGVTANYIAVQAGYATKF